MPQVSLFYSGQMLGADSWDMLIKQALKICGFGFYWKQLMCASKLWANGHVLLWRSKAVLLSRGQMTLIYIIPTQHRLTQEVLRLPQHWKCESESCSVVPDSLWPHRLYSPWHSPGQNTGVGSLSFLQGIFPTQGLDPGLPHCGRILCQLSHKGSPRWLEWVAYPVSWPRNRTRVSCITGGFFTSWALRETPISAQAPHDFCLSGVLE